MVEVLGQLFIGAFVVTPLALIWVLLVIENRARAKRRQPTPLEMYALRRQRKNDAMRQMRRVARERQRSNYRR